jgi:threonine dehydrogenase-like Zn-dependent dehydrogenase
MRALCYSGVREVTCHQRPDPRPGSNEVLIKLQASGICGSDLHVYRHPGADFVDSARVPGHEPAGIIAEVGLDVRGWSVGDRVTAYFRPECFRRVKGIRRVHEPALERQRCSSR